MPPKPNYSFEKRQRELEKKKKKAEKAQRKAEGDHVSPQPDDDQRGVAPAAPNAAPTA